MACCNNNSCCSNTYRCNGCCCTPVDNDESYNFTCYDNRCFTPLGGLGIFGRRWPLGGLSYTGGFCCVYDETPVE